MIETEEAVTAHGTVEYDTVKCASCGTQVVQEDASAFVVIDPEDISVRNATWDHGTTKWKVSERRAHIMGMACPHCAEDPARIPANPKKRTIVLHAYELLFIVLTIIGFSLFTGLVIP